MKKQGDNPFVTGLLAAMEADGWKMKPLSEAAGLSESMIRDLLRNNSSPKVSSAHAIASVMGRSIDELIALGKSPGTTPPRSVVAPRKNDSPRIRDDAAPFTPRPVPSGASLDAYLAPVASHRLTWRSTVAAPVFGILAGDVLVIDMKAAARAGDVVLLAKQDGDTSETRIARYAPPWFITSDPRETPLDEKGARIQGPIIAVARGAGLEPA